MADEKQESQKTLVAFVVGLLIGGMLVWAFSGPSADAPVSVVDTDTTEEIESTDAEETSEVSENNTSEVSEAPKLEVGDGKIVVNDQPASAMIELDSAVYPISEGWIGVRQYTEGNLTYLLGVVRFSEAAGLIPDQIVLQRSTTPGREYAIVIYTENGDNTFSLDKDVQIDKIFDTFTAE